MTTGSSASSADGKMAAHAQQEFGELDVNMLSAVVFELASQLHLERARRIALEAALAQRGVLNREDIEVSGESAACRKEAGAAADVAVRKLLRVLSESSDERVPLRAEAPRPVAGER